MSYSHQILFTASVHVVTRHQNVHTHTFRGDRFLCNRTAVTITICRISTLTKLGCIIYWQHAAMKSHVYQCIDSNLPFVYQWSFIACLIWYHIDHRWYHIDTPHFIAVAVTSVQHKKAWQLHGRRGLGWVFVLSPLAYCILMEGMVDIKFGEITLFEYYIATCIDACLVTLASIEFDNLVIDHQTTKCAKFPGIQSIARPAGLYVGLHNLRSSAATSRLYEPTYNWLVPHLP